VTFAAGDTLPADRLNVMGCTLRRASNQTLNDATDTTISWDTEVVDTDALWDAGTPTVITIPETGLWAITFHVARAAAVNARSLVDIVTSAAPWSSLNNFIRAPWPTGEDRGCGSFTIPLTAADTFTVRVNADGSGNSTMLAGLTCYRVIGG